MTDHEILNLIADIESAKENYIKFETALDVARIAHEDAEDDFKDAKMELSELRTKLEDYTDGLFDISGEDEDHGSISLSGW